IDGETWLGLDVDVKGSIYEGLLEHNAQEVKSGAGQYFTPRALIDAMVTVVDPEPRETIHDPACGTGGFLLAAWEHRRKKPLARNAEIYTALRSRFSGIDIVLFEGGAGETIRRRLLHNFDFHTLVRLPTGIFYKQGVKANVLFFDKKRVSAEPNTKELWIYDLRTNQRFTLKERPMVRADLDDFVACYQSGSRHERAETDRFRRLAPAELAARDKITLDI